MKKAQVGTLLGNLYWIRCTSWSDRVLWMARSCLFSSQSILCTDRGKQTKKSKSKQNVTWKAKKLNISHKTLQARETDHLQKSCGLSQFLFHIFSPPSVLHTLGDFKKNRVNSLWEMGCQRVLSLLVRVCLSKTQRCCPLRGVEQPSSLTKKSLLLQTKSKSFSSFSQSRTCQVFPLSSS